mgnify:FL=1
MEKTMNEITLNVIKAKTTMEPVGFCNIILSCKRNIDNVMDTIIATLPEARKTAKKVKKQVSVAEVLDLMLEFLSKKCPDVTVLDVNDETGKKSIHQINWYLS